MASRNAEKFYHCLSKIFQPAVVIPKDIQIKHQALTSKSQRLMMELGIVRQANPGCFHLLPLGVRSLEKLVKLVDFELKRIGSQKVIFPTLTSTKLWKATGRFDSVSPELFKVQDRHEQSYILSPTHEEAAADLVASISPVSYKQLPLKMYQITSKFRDEMKPRFGLIRGKQFIMKDLYSFDSDTETAQKTYAEVSECYDRIFTKIGVDFVRVSGHLGHMGGNLSHEYHYKTGIGEDNIFVCGSCGYLANVELSSDDECPKCKSRERDTSSSIEVGHTFLLGDRYSRPLNATYLSKDGKPTVLQMGSYGLGMSRIIAASIEVLSLEEEIRWPPALVPYTVAIIPPKKGSKEEQHLEGKNLVENLYDRLSVLQNLEDDIVIDDRTSLTIGRRYLDAQRVGYPYIIALGKKITQDPPLYELTDLRQDKQQYLSENELVNYVKENVGQ